MAANFDPTLPDSKYLGFNRVKWSGKTWIVDVISKSSGIPLGEIKWWGPWRQYCFFPGPETLYNPGCLDAIKTTIRVLADERKGGKID